MLSFKLSVGIASLALSCFVVSSLALNLARIYRYKIESNIASLGSFFFYKHLLAKVFGNKVCPLGFNLLISSQILRHFCSIFIGMWCIPREGNLALSVFYVILSTILLETLWEILPRWISVSNSLQVQQYFALFSSFILFVLSPISAFLTWLFLKKRNPSRNSLEDFRDKMRDVIHDVNETGLDDPTSQTLLKGVLRYHDRIVREVMVPRVKVIAIHGQATLSEALELWLEEGYTRTPIFQDSIDHIVGILMSRDLFQSFLASRDDPSLLNSPVASLGKNPFFIPETISLGRMLQEFRIRQAHLAIVVDEYGGTSGVITIEDVLGELVGDISDEYDEDEEEEIVLCSDGSYLTDAKTSLYLVEEQLDISIPRHADYESINGYIFFVTGIIPKAGFRIYHDMFDIEILSSNERSVEKVKIYIHSKSKFNQD
ncbi:hemolysin family protein [Candidatus Similichlamydia epinepheli]|uniref:hemolysin family protein n=1 Tax=Candidatus Similichlamydia epinepheli TaxID=1903953 RepID=UPI000D35FAD4|nr:hemolysin family protein [Candidatus Similichlamydia epinepheli]